MKADAFGAFIAYNKIEIIGNGFVHEACIGGFAVMQLEIAFYFGAFFIGPFYAAFIDGGIGAFGFAGSAVNTFVSDNNGHK